METTFIFTNGDKRIVVNVGTLEGALKSFKEIHAQYFADTKISDWAREGVQQKNNK